MGMADANFDEEEHLPYQPLQTNRAELFWKELWVMSGLMPATLSPCFVCATVWVQNAFQFA